MDLRLSLLNVLFVILSGGSVIKACYIPKDCSDQGDNQVKIMYSRVSMGGGSSYSKKKQLIVKMRWPPDIFVRTVNIITTFYRILSAEDK